MSPTPEEIIRHHDSQPPEGASPRVAGARPRRGIEVVAPDPAWPWAFGKLEARIRTALGADALGFEHVGSTAVPGLPAKPVRHRIFRDWLTSHPADRDCYRDAKLGAAHEANEAGEHVMDYNARKEPVIRDIYDRAFRAAGLLP